MPGSKCPLQKRESNPWRRGPVLNESGPSRDDIERYVRELERLLLEVELERSQLKDALKSREVVAEAMGILMAREQCGEQDAFEKLKTLARERNMKLRQAAEGVVVEQMPDRKHPRLRRRPHLRRTRGSRTRHYHRDK
jgi:hypothetical protein